MLPILRLSRAILTLAVVLAAGFGGWPPTCAAADWADSRTLGPFICRADFPLQGLEGPLGELVQLQADLARHLGIPRPAEPIEVYLLHDENTYAQYLKRYLPNVPYRRALYLKGDGPGMVFAHRGPQFEVDLRHECTHALLHAVLPEVPLWLDEGLAVYFEVPAQRRPFDNLHLESLRRSVRLGMVPPLEWLESKADFAEITGAEYAYAWGWVHFMLHGSAEGHEELVAYLADMRKGAPPVQLSVRLRRRLDDPAKQLAVHFQTWRRSARGDTRSGSPTRGN
jgi:hypothetical protein